MDDERFNYRVLNDETKILVNITRLNYLKTGPIFAPTMSRKAPDTK